MSHFLSSMSLVVRASRAHLEISLLDVMGLRMAIDGLEKEEDCPK